MEAGRHWLDAERLRVYPRIFVGVYAVAVLAYALSVHDGLDFRGQVLGSDFVTFYAAARLALSGHGVDAWNLDALLAMQHQVFPAYAGKGFAWFYPPTFLLVVTPLALLPHLAALAVFVGTTATGWALALRRAIGARAPAGWSPRSPACGSARHRARTACSPPPSPAARLLTLRRRPVLSGVLLGLLVVKPHLAALFAVALLAVRAWRTMLVAAGTALVFLGASLLAFGWAALPAWLDSLQVARVATESGALPWAKMPSTFALLRLLGTPVTWAYAGHAVIAIAAAVAVWVVWRRTDALPLRGAVLMAATFLANPYAFDYDLVWLAFPIAWLAVYGLENGWRRGDREVLVAAWLLPALATALASLTRVQVAPLVLAALVWVAVRRVVPGRGLPGWLAGVSAPSGPPARAQRRSSPPA
ncbi:MAG: glycosyltransferase family 87 protein [Propionicimonas sp.]